MGSVSVAEVQELVRQLSAEKLPHAYRLLRDLAEQQGNASAQVEFMRLPVADRRRLLTQQAAEMVSYYQETTADRQDWQTGDLRDEY
jgi:hypothetical protein